MRSQNFIFVGLFALVSCKPSLPSSEKAISIAESIFELGGRANCKDQKLISSKPKEDAVETSWICIDDLGQRVSVLVYVDAFGDTDILRMGVDDMNSDGEKISIDIEKKKMSVEKDSSPNK